MQDKSVVVLGLGFGDEGKGATVDYLASTGRYGAVVRFNGGCQTAHNVVLPDGTHHTFAQFGSGTLRGLKTFLSEHMLVEPFSLMNENAALSILIGEVALNGLYVSSDALVTTPFHKALNQARERDRGYGNHGTCGRGIGETTRYALRAGANPIRVKDLLRRKVMTDKLLELRDWCESEVPGCTDHLGSFSHIAYLVDEYRNIANMLQIVQDDSHILKTLSADKHLIFEGAQGVLLDEKWGFPPHNTWTNTTTDHALDLASAAGIDEVHTYGVVRAYGTRHGAGPFPTELFPEHGNVQPTEPHNSSNGWQGDWRTGNFDGVLLRYAMNVDQPDSLVVNHLDQVGETVSVAYGYELSGEFHYALPLDDQPTEDDTKRLAVAVPVYKEIPTAELIGEIESQTLTRVSITSSGPTSEDRKVR